MSHAIPKTFVAKKTKILADLSIPDADYTDKSPKGSVDEPIRDLINLINSHPGWCTTSSCSGRVAVFVEGPKHGDLSGDGEDDTDGKIKTGPGGKGGGRWLFVSHDPMKMEDRQRFGLGQEISLPTTNGQAVNRLVNLTFSPLILHVLCASLHHAKPLLAAAINAGFRESGVQSLKALDEPEVGVMVAIRTAGVAFTSTVGVAQDGEEAVKRVVSDDYLKMCVTIVNQRFEANGERKRRLVDALGKAVQGAAGDTESKEERWRRKRQEGLERQKRRDQSTMESSPPYDDLEHGDLNFG